MIQEVDKPKSLESQEQPRREQQDTNNRDTSQNKVGGIAEPPLEISTLKFKTGDGRGEGNQERPNNTSMIKSYRYPVRDLNEAIEEEAAMRSAGDSGNPEASAGDDPKTLRESGSVSVGQCHFIPCSGLGACFLLLASSHWSFMSYM